MIYILPSKAMSLKSIEMKEQNTNIKMKIKVYIFSFPFSIHHVVSTFKLIKDQAKSVQELQLIAK